MAKPELVATRNFKYLTRRLLPGDIFEAKNDTEGRILVNVRRVAEPANLERAPKLAPKPTTDERAALRAEYQAKVGKKPYNGWDAATLRAKIAAA